MKKLPVPHPFLFAVFPVLFLYAHNATLIPPGEIVMPLVIVTGFSLCTTLLLTLLVRDRMKCAVILSLFLLLFFSYGHVIRALPNFHFTVKSLNLGPDEFVFPVWCGLLFLGTYATIGTRRSLHTLTRVLNVAAVVLVTIQLAGAMYAFASRPTTAVVRQITTADSAHAQVLPDIYYIVLDGYGRADVLKEIYNYDNSEFLDFLQEKGFQVANDSRANYCQTTLSLASTLNLDYLHRLAYFDRRSKDRRPVTQWLKSNRVFDLVKHHGYTLVAFASGYTATEFTDADSYLSPGLTLSEFNNILLTTTPLPFVLRMGKTQYDLHRERISYILAKLPHVDEGASPRLVFAHIIAPHPPFVFGKNGEPVARKRLFNFSDGSYYYAEGGAFDEYVNGYRNQVAYVNRRLRTTIDGILSDAKDNPPVIILQGDHGPGAYLDWYNLPQTNLKERFSILNAYYLPRAHDDLIYNEISPVNTFRIIFNQYLGAKLQLLPDECYYTTWSRPYHFFNVTDPERLPPFPGELE